MRNTTFRIKKTSSKTSAAYSAVVKPLATKAGFCLPPSPRLRRTSLPSAFTLIELLVVIAIIAILAGVIAPTFFKTKTQAREAKAKATVKALEAVFKSYLDTYKVWPAAFVDGNINGDIFRIMRGENVNSANSQLIAFYDFESVTNSAMDQTTAYDPWSNPDDSVSWFAYQVMFDKNYDNKISISGQDVYRCVLVWSVGNDRADNLGDGDDVASWK